MSLWVIIPVKPLNRAKSRLKDVLTSEQRYDFAQSMLRRMLTVLRDIPHIAGTIVISRDTKALAIARELGAKTVQEDSSSDLNPALNRATEVIRVWGGKAILILPADLPFVTEEDIIDIANMGRYGSTVVIATDNDENGTNALLVRPVGLFPYTYGEGSFQRHIIAAKLANADVKIYESDTIQLDIDTPADLAEYNRRLAEQEYHELSPFLPDMLAE